MTENLLKLPADYWQTLQLAKDDVDSLHNYLFDTETPLTTRELVRVLVERRIETERKAFAAQKQANGKTYKPKEHYQAGDRLVFPALGWRNGEVKSIRPGQNPDIGEFEVLTVLIDGEERQFAAGLEDHLLNKEEQALPEDDEMLQVDVVLRKYGSLLEQKLDAALRADGSLVPIAGRWFPRALLLDINAGQLNLAEAVLDMAGGEPLPPSALMKDIELPPNINPALAEFSLNYALQEDGRFDEVGPAGQVLWCLERLEPETVRQPPVFLRYTPIPYDPQVLTADMRAMDADADDELSDGDWLPADEDVREVTISLLYPHWRGGTLPISKRMHSLFPTAYISPRVRFTLVDARSGQKMPAWVVRQHGYVYGLADWYKKQELMPGSLIRVRRSDKMGEVLLEAQSRRATRDWVRTAIVGTDGGLVFAMLKQVIASDFNERMVVAVPDPEAVDKLWIQKNSQPLEYVVIGLMRELSKLTPQGHVHAQELYSALNLLRRCPPAPLLSLLASRPVFVHVGDLYFRLDESKLK